MKSDKRWVSTVIVSTLLFLILIAIVNIKINTFGVFKTNVSIDEINDRNTRYTKIEHLLNSDKLYTSFFVGGSRVGVFKPSTIEKYLTDERFYNLTVSQAACNENYLHSKFLVEQYHAKTLFVLVGLDQMSNSEQNNSRTNRLHYEVSGENIIPYYLNYITMVDIKSLLKFNEDSFEIIYRNRIFNADGTWQYQLNEKKIIENPNFNNVERKEFCVNNSRIVGGGAIEKTVEYLRMIKCLCEKHDTKLYIILTPHNHIMMDTFVLQSYLDFLKSLSEVTDYWDFSGYNSVTINDRNYYETSHFRFYVGDWVIKRVLGQDTVDVPEDFGVLISKSNIDEHLKKSRVTVEFWDKNKQLTKAK